MALMALNYIRVLSWSTRVVFEAHPPDELHLLGVAEQFGHACAGFLLEETELQALSLVYQMCSILKCRRKGLSLLWTALSHMW